MMDSKNLWVVIPAFNEGKVIGDVVRQVRLSFSNLVVIDDCSGDDTAACATSAGARVVRHVINLGQGAALQTGIDFAMRQGASGVVTFDADGQHDIHDVQKMLDIQSATGADIVLGSRFTGTTFGMSKARRLLLKMAVLFTWLTSGVRLSDAHNGLRLLTRNAMVKIRITQNRMAHASEIIEQIGRRKLTFAEAPCTIAYTQYSIAKGQSGFGAVKIVMDLMIAKISK